MNGELYSPADDEIIRRGYDRRETLTQMAAKLSRSIHSVGGRAQALGLRHPNGTRNGAAKCSKWAIDCSPDIPTLAFVPGLPPSEKYQMREA